MPSSTSRYNRRHGSGSLAAKQKLERLLQRLQNAQESGRVEHAWTLCESALTLAPDNIDLLCTYGSLAVKVGLPEVGVEAGRRATHLRPDRAETHHCLGVALRHRGELQHAIASLTRALELEPSRLDSLLELGTAFLDAGDASTAEPLLNRAVALDWNSPLVQTSLGRLHAATGRADEAIAAYRRAIELDPKQWSAQNQLGNVLRDAGDLDGSIVAFRQAIALAPDRPDLWSNLLLTLQCTDAESASEIAAQHRAFGRHFAKQLMPLPAPPRASRSGERLKIGYLSSHFRRHAVAKFFEPLIAAHDRNRFEIHCYYNGMAPDDITDRIRGRAEHFSTVCGMRDGYVAAQIRRDGIDILVDLDGHTMPNRLPVFFLRAAPIQVTWLGYLATTGITAVDYRLTDPRADPPGLTEGFHTERLWRLPTTAWCYQPYDEAPASGPSPLAANGFVTFVSLNNPGKLTRSLLELWIPIMLATPGSRLNLHVSTQQSRIAELRTFFDARGIDASRIALIERQSIDRYFALYDASDIALDTWPCAGGTTTCDAMWMGVPVVTLAGERSFSRTGASLLASVGLGELIAQTPDEYVAKAIALAHDPEQLTELRAGLRTRMQSSCLTDGPALAREVETSFVEMWQRHATHQDGKGH